MQERYISRSKADPILFPSEENVFFYEPTGLRIVDRWMFGGDVRLSQVISALKPDWHSEEHTFLRSLNGEGKHTSRDVIRILNRGKRLFTNGYHAELAQNCNIQNPPFPGVTREPNDQGSFPFKLIFDDSALAHMCFLKRRYVDLVHLVESGETDSTWDSPRIKNFSNYATVHTKPGPNYGNTLDELNEDTRIGYKLHLAAVEGDKKAWEDLTWILGGVIRLAATNQDSNRERSRDVIQEMTIKLGTTRIKSQPPSFVNYVSRMTRNLAIDHYRKTRIRRHGGKTSELEMLEDTPDVVQARLEIPDETDPLELIIAEERNELALEAYAVLKDASERGKYNPAYLTALHGQFFLGEKSRETSKRLGKPEGTIKIHRKRGLEAANQLLRTRGIGFR